MTQVYRGYIISADSAFPSLLSVAVEGRGGKIPNVLSGRFTSHREVTNLVDHYLEQSEAKARGKTSPTK